MKCIQCNKEEPNKDSGLCSSCEAQEMRKINGLLYLPALGLIVGSILCLFDLYSFSSEVIKFYKTSGFISYYSIGAIIFLIVGAFITLITAWLFFNRKTGTKKTIIIYYIFNLISAVYFTVFPSTIFNVTLGENDIRVLSGSIFGVVIWMPYFIFSKRIPIVFYR